MADSYLNIVSFLLVTLFYYIALKPSLNIDTLADQEKYKKYLNVIERITTKKPTF